MRDRVHGILTYDGRVVYDRKKKTVKWPDVWRFCRNVYIPPHEKAQIAAVKVLKRCLRVLTNVPWLLGTSESDPKYYLQQDLRREFEWFQEFYAPVPVPEPPTELECQALYMTDDGGWFGGGGATGEF